MNKVGECSRIQRIGIITGLIVILFVGYMSPADIYATPVLLDYNFIYPAEESEDMASAEDEFYLKEDSTSVNIETDGREYVSKEGKINISIAWPQIIGMRDQNIQAAINNSIKENSIIKDFDDSIEDDYGLDEVHSFDIIYNQNKILSIKWNFSYYFTGTVHWWHSISIENIDLTTGKSLELKDVITGDYKNILEWLHNTENIEPHHRESLKTVNIAELDFSIDTDGLIFYLHRDPGAYPDFAAILVPYEDLRGIIGKDSPLRRFIIE